MKKLILAVLCLSLVTCLLAGCADDAQTQRETKLKIAATTFPLYDWVRQIAGEREQELELTMLLDNGVDYHSYQPSVEDIVNISGCDLFLCVGGSSEAWVEDALREAVNPDVTVIRLMDQLGNGVKTEELVEGMEADAEEAAEEDEHVWLSLRNAMLFCGAISETLCRLDPEGAAVYRENTEAYTARLQQLDDQLSAAAAGGSVKTLLFADRFPFRYLTDDYGLSYYAAFTGCSSETAASFETVAFLARKTDELGLRYVLRLETSDGALAQTVLDSTEKGDQQILTLNSMQTVTPEQLQSGVTYLSVMQDNADTLCIALANGSEQAAEREPGLYLLSRLNNAGGLQISGADCRGEEAALFATRWDENDTERWIVFFLDLEGGEVNSFVEIPHLPDLASGDFSLTEDGLLKFSRSWDGVAAIYDRQGRFLRFESCREPEDGLPQLADELCFSRLEGCAWHSFRIGAEDRTAVVLQDAPERISLFDGNLIPEKRLSDGALVCTSYTEHSVEYLLLDPADGTVTDSRKITEPEGWVSGRYIAGDSDGILLVVQVSQGERCEDRICFWRPGGADPVQIPCRTILFDELPELNRTLARQILQEDEIRLHLDEAPPPEYTPTVGQEDEPQETTCVTGAADYGVYTLLLQLKGFLDTLPEGFTHEMYTDYPVPEEDHDSFDVYIVREIPGSSAAFAYYDDEEFLICFATEEFYPDHLPHEFMHLIEARIHSQLESEPTSLWERWDELNDGKEVYYNEDAEYDENYFVSYYAMTNQMEDRAETFANIYTCDEPMSQKEWYAGHLPVQNKVRLLLSSIREAYPSVRAVKTAVWEKFYDGNEK